MNTLGKQIESAQRKKEKEEERILYFFNSSKNIHLVSSECKQRLGEKHTTGFFFRDPTTKKLCLLLSLTNDTQTTDTENIMAKGHRHGKQVCVNAEQIPTATNATTSHSKAV